MYGATGLPAVTVTSAPQGACSCRWATRASRAASGSSPGAIRRASLARAEGTRSRPASSTAGASIATTDSDGALPEPGGQRAAADQGDAVEDARVGAELVLGQVQRVGGAAAETLHGHVALGVVAGREQVREGGQGVRRRTAVHPAVQGVPQRAHLHHDVDPAAQRRGQRGYADPPVRRVGEHEHVGRQPLPVLGEQGRPGWGSRSPPRRRSAPRPTRLRPRPGRARPPGAPRSRPCRRQLPARRAAPLVRPARTDRCPSGRGRRPAARRGGRRAAPSVRRERPGGTRSPQGGRRRRSRSRRRSARRRRAAGPPRPRWPTAGRAPRDLRRPTGCGPGVPGRHARSAGRTVTASRVTIGRP